MQKTILPEGVQLRCSDRAVHLTTNDALMRFLRQRGNGSLPLSQQILDTYAAQRGVPLGISVRSMATELLIHAYLDGVFAAWERFGARLRPNGRFARLAGRLKGSTAVIDMGEKSVDANRWVFDVLSHGYGLLCALLGSRA